MSKKVRSPIAVPDTPSTCCNTSVSSKAALPSKVVNTSTPNLPVRIGSSAEASPAGADQLLKEFYVRQTTNKVYQEPVGCITNQELARRSCLPESNDCAIVFDGPVCGIGQPSISAGTSSVLLGEVVFSNSNSVSFGLSGRTVTASFAGGGGGSPFAVSASGSSVSSGTVVFSNANSFSFGMVGSTITASYIPGSGSQTVQTQNCVDLSLSGNTSGALALISSGTAILAGGNNITLSQNGQSVTISAANFSQTIQTQNAVDLSLSGNTSGALVLISSGTAIFAGGNNITLSQNGQSITISAANITQSTQTQNLFDLSLSGNTSGVLALISSGTAILAGGNNITLSQNAQSITISAANQTVQTVGLYMSSNTTSSVSSGTADARSLTFRGAGVASVGYSGGEVIISVPSAAGDGGNVLAAGTQTANTTGTVLFQDSNGISFGMDNSSVVTASYTVPTIPAAGSISAGSTFATLGQVVFSNSNSITFGMNAGTVTATVSYPAQTVQTQNCVDLSLSGNTSGALALISSGTAILAGGNNITLSQNAQSITISAANQTVQTQNLIDVTLSGNTSGVLALISSGTMTLAGGNNITLSQAGNAVTISGVNTVAQTNQTIGLYAVSNTTQSSSGTEDARSLSFAGAGIASVGITNGSVVISVPSAAGDGGNVIAAGTQTANSTGTVSFADSNGISFGMSNNSIVTASYTVPTQTVQTQNLFDLTLSGNTSGTLALISSGTMTLAGGNNITLSQSGNAITISGPNTSSQTVQTQNCVDVSLSGNTSGTLTLISSGTAIFAGGNNITLSQNAQSVTISAFNQTVQTQNVVDLSIAGNTSGTKTLISSGTAILAGGNNITLSQNGQSITISGPNIPAAASNTFIISDNLGGGLGTLQGSAILLSILPGDNISIQDLLVGGTGTSDAFAIYAPQYYVGVTGHTTGTAGLIWGVGSSAYNLWLAGGNNVTLSQSINTLLGASVGTITISAANQTVQTQNLVDISLSGNTSGTLTIISSGTAILAGGNNITLSQNGQSITVSGPNAPVNTFYYTGNEFSNLGTSQIVSATGSQVLVGVKPGFNITFAQLATDTLNTSMEFQINAPIYQFDGSLGNTVGTTGFVGTSTGVTRYRFNLAGGNNVTLSQSIVSTVAGRQDATVTISSPNYAFGVSNLGNTSGTSGTFGGSGFSAYQQILVGGNNVTLSQSFNTASQSFGTITISAANQTNQTVGLYMSSNTTSSVSSGTVDARSMTFRGVGNVSVGYSNGEVILSGATAATAIAFSAGGSSANVSSLIFSNSNNVSFGLSGSTVTASAAAQTVQTQNCVDLSIGGNTSGTSTIISSGTAILLGGNNITLSQSGQSITISAFNESVQTQNCVDISLAGNTSGVQTIISSGTAIFAGGNNITLSQNGQNVTISAANSAPQTLSFYQNIPNLVGMVTGASAVTVTSGSSIFIQPFVLPNYQSIGYVRLLASLNDSAVGTAGTTSANTTASVERYTTIAIVVYSQGVGASSNSIQYIASASVGITGRTIFSMGAGGASAYTITIQKTYPNTGAVNVQYTSSYGATSASIKISSNSNTLFTGPQFIDIPFATLLSPGNYWLGIGGSTSSNSNSALISFAGTCAMPISLAAVSQSNVSVGLMGQVTSASQYQLQPGLGLWTTNASLISTSSIGLNSISQLLSNVQIPFQFIRQA